MIPSLYLASQSPRRRELLQQIGVDFSVLSVDVPEQRQAKETPQEYVTRLATSKAKAGGMLVAESGVPVLGADTIVVLGERVMEKPASAADGVEMLLALSGRQHQVMTAVSCFTSKRQQTMLSVTDVLFREISEAEAQRYWGTGEPCDKAGGYAIQGLGALFVKSLHGSYSGVVGLPLEVTYELLSGFRVPYWQVAMDAGVTGKLQK